MSEKFSEAVGKVVGEYTWLMVDALLLLFLLAATLAYRDFDEPMRLLFRGGLIAFWAFVWVSGLHMLVYLRVTERGRNMPGILSYTCFAGKLGIILLFAIWARSKGLV